MTSARDQSDSNDAALWRPGKLWSLWNIMHKLRADIFFKAYEQTSAFNQMLTLAPQPELTLLARDIAELIDRLTILIEELNSMGMMGTAVVLARGLELLKSAPEKTEGGRQLRVFLPENKERIKTALSQGASRLPDDLIGQVLLIVDPAKIRYHDQSALFGDDVFKAFPSANEDIAEAGTCLALDRGTATVMHLQRVLEVGLSALAAALSIKKQNDWGRYLREIDDELNRRMKSSGARTADEQFYAEAATTIDAMRRAWRNPTMHPEKTYSPERAEEILQSVRSFMRHLATKLHE